MWKTDSNYIYSIRRNHPDLHIEHVSSPFGYFRGWFVTFAGHLTLHLSSLIILCLVSWELIEMGFDMNLTIINSVRGQISITVCENIPFSDSKYHAKCKGIKLAHLSPLTQCADFTLFKGILTSSILWKLIHEQVLILFSFGAYLHHPHSYKA